VIEILGVGGEVAGYGEFQDVLAAQVNDRAPELCRCLDPLDQRRMIIGSRSTLQHGNCRAAPLASMNDAVVCVCRLHCNVTYGARF
jgi:hypothetical protein